MVDNISEILIKQQYKKITSNVPFVNLYMIAEGDRARVVQLIDCEQEIRLTVPQFQAFCGKAEEYIREKGYESLDFLSIVVTPMISEARKFILGSYKCWIIDNNLERLLIYENQPSDFYGLKAEIESIAEIAGLSHYYNVERHEPEYIDNAGATSFRDEFTLVNTIMVFLNVFIFIAMSVIGNTNDVDFMLNHGSMYAPAVTENHEYYRFFTCMFLHFGFTHIAGNMVVLLFLGDNVERAVGKLKYLLIYVLGGLIGSVGSFLYAQIYNKGIVSAGASGAIFALIGALLVLVIRNKGKLENMTTLRVCVLIAYALYNGFTSENVDMAAHLFGLMGGFVIALILYRGPAGNDY